jgi:adenylate kinase family enzyme
MIIQIIGFPGSGKTELAKVLKERINAIHLNADERGWNYIQWGRK